MVPRLLRPFKGRRGAEEEQAEPAPSAGPANQQDYVRQRHATADFTEADDDDDEDSNDDDNDLGVGGYRDRVHDGRGEEDEDGFRRQSNILPLFSASHLDSLPVYSITHSIRIIVQARTETTLTWEQLRSPQVSQFLLKPMQLQIRTQHFSRATLYALLANCLQFHKEGYLYPGNAGTSSTRAKVCELLAIKLLKEYSTRELIDALSYDFYPLQGLPGTGGVGYGTPPNLRGGGASSGGARPRAVAARTSTLEVAIRTSAKNFLSHPLVIQQLEAIWNGAISFYSAADSLHRVSIAPTSPGGGHNRAAGASSNNNSGRRRSQPDARTPLLGSSSRQGPGKEDSPRSAQDLTLSRRTVALYNPRNASLFKLSRLRVPRYRQFLSTLSLAILIGLFIAVLQERPSRISSLELVFWFWSAGFMLDELVGFTEQGFSLYIMSFWNIFDLGILLMLIIYYCMRLYGVFLVDARQWSDSAYDVLAATGILLLPRVCSVLDHYQYFSQLLIAFRMMALDLAAILILVLIACSGFFVFFTMSKHSSSGIDTAFRIFQILMGFTPAAWEVWPTYDWLGKTLLGFFLVICHFVVVTILITVLTNSFMTIASNAHQEHQFLFAINTISMVKNDALFSYVAPGNIFAWMLMPLRYCMPLRQFVALNRFTIKVTHFPLLFSIYFYERFFLAPSMYAPTDLVENPGRSRQRAISFGDPTSRAALFSPNVRVREESVLGYQKDHALEEVFRRAPDMATPRTQRRNERRKTQTAIRHWMDQQHEGGTPYSTIDNRQPQPGGPEWQRRLSVHYHHRGEGGGPRRFQNISDVRSAASDPADLISNAAYPPLVSPYGHVYTAAEHRHRDDDQVEIKDNTDADGDDEFVTNDEDEDDNATNNAAETRRGKQPESAAGAGAGAIEEDYFTTPIATRFGALASSSLDSLTRTPGPNSPRPAPRKGLHSRTLSSNTILYNPPEKDPPEGGVLGLGLASSLGSSPGPLKTRSRPISNRQTPAATTPSGNAGPGSDNRSPRRTVYHANARPRSMVALPPRDIIAGPSPATAGPSSSSRAIATAGLTLDTHARRAQRRRLSSFDLLDAAAVAAPATDPLPAAEDDDDDDGHDPSGLAGAVPSSFATQMAMATGMMTPLGGGRHAAAAASAAAAAASRETNDRLNRLVLARMKTLEEGFADVVRELRVLQQQQQQQIRSNQPFTAYNSGGELLGRGHGGHGQGGAATTTIEVAGAHQRRRTGVAGGGVIRPRPRSTVSVGTHHYHHQQQQQFHHPGRVTTTAAARPSSRRSMREERVGMPGEGGGGGGGGGGKEKEKEKVKTRTPAEFDDTDDDDGLDSSFTRRGSSL